MLLRRTFLLLATLALTAPATSAQGTLAGTWELESYESTASVGKASGLLIIGGGRFSLVYTMAQPDGGTSGRAHAGEYTHRGNELLLDVKWQVEQVSGKGSATAAVTRHPTRMALTGNRLTLTFANGGVQRFKRLAK